jgi:alpha-1,2-mannosyltransferase
LIVGVFSPVINWCGGAEWVAVNMMTALKEHGHQTIILTDRPLNQEKFKHVFNRKVPADQQIVLPLRLFSPSNYHNIYTDSIRSLVLKTKCEVLIDTFSNAILPGANVAYIHHPLLKKVQNELPDLKNKIYFFPYKNFLKSQQNSINKRLIFANSKFTAEAIETEIGVEPHVLYPSVSNEILNNNYMDFNKQRDDAVTTVARIDKGKNLYMIPHIAKLIRKDITFTIAGLLDNETVLDSLLNLIRQLGVSDRVRIETNVKREELRKILFNSKVYLHPKVSEHFGISIIEGMAAGCIPVVHNSGGPREFVPPNQRFNSIEEAADIVEKAIDSWSPTQARKVAEETEKFGENHFSKQFIDAIDGLFH